MPEQYGWRPVFDAEQSRLQRQWSDHLMARGMSIFRIGPIAFDKARRRVPLPKGED